MKSRWLSSENGAVPWFWCKVGIPSAGLCRSDPQFSIMGIQPPSFFRADWPPTTIDYWAFFCFLILIDGLNKKPIHSPIMELINHQWLLGLAINSNQPSIIGLFNHRWLGGYHWERESSVSPASSGFGPKTPSGVVPDPANEDNPRPTAPNGWRCHGIW